MNRIEAIKQLKEIDYMDGEMEKLFNVINDLDNEELREKITTHLHDEYITTEEEEKYYFEGRLDNEWDLNAMRCAIGETDYNSPIMKNGYGNLENTNTRDVINEVVEILEDE